MYACSRSHWGSWLESLCCRRDLLPRSMLTRSQRTRRRLSALCRQWPAGQHEKLSNDRNWVIGRRCAILGPCPLCPRKRTNSRHLGMSAFGGEFNESTQHLLIFADEEVCEWRGMHGPGSRRNRRLSCGSAGRAVNVWRTSRERLRGGTRAASIGSWLAMEGLLQRHAGGLW